jgi:hypothetical protein
MRVVWLWLLLIVRCAVSLASEVSPPAGCKQIRYTGPVGFVFVGYSIESDGGVTDCSGYTEHKIDVFHMCKDGSVSIVGSKTVTSSDSMGLIDTGVQMVYACRDSLFRVCVTPEVRTEMWTLPADDAEMKLKNVTSSTGVLSITREEVPLEGLELTVDLSGEYVVGFSGTTEARSCGFFEFGGEKIHLGECGEGYIFRLFINNERYGKDWGYVQTAPKITENYIPFPLDISVIGVQLLGAGDVLKIVGRHAHREHTLEVYAPYLWIAGPREKKGDHDDNSNNTN